MSIINRTLHPSQQMDWVTWTSPQSQGNSFLVLTGATLLMEMMPYPGTVQTGKIAALGVSNAMQLSLGIHRYVNGGLTLITCGISNMVLQNLSVSGPIGFSGLAPAGSTLLNFLAGDVMFLTTSVSSASCVSLVLELVVKKTQDIVTFNGVLN